MPFGSFLAKRYAALRVARLLMWRDHRALKRPPTTLGQSINLETGVVYGAGWSRAEAPSYNTRAESRFSGGVVYGAGWLRAKAPSHNTANAVAVLQEALRFRL